jgi:hypothetical protein
VFAAGGGRIGAMTTVRGRCLGQGQFRPLDGSQPFIGEAGQVEQVEEWKVELVVADELIRCCGGCLKQSHPYETPAYEVWRLEDF